MKRSKIILLAVLALLILAAAFFLLTRQRREVLKPIFTADSTAVAKITLADPSGSVTFAKSGRLWTLAEPIKWNVEEQHFQNFFGRVILAKYATTPVASGDQAIGEYGLGEERTLKVKAFNARGKLIREAWFSNPGSPFDYFRFPGRADVFLVRQKVAGFFTPKLESWRSPHVLRIFPDQMLSIRVSHPKNSYELTRDGSLWHYKDKVEEFDVPPGNITLGKLLNILTRLGSYTILSGENKPDPGSLGPSACDVSIAQTDGGEVRISFYPYENNYLMTVDSHPGLYFTVIFDTVFRFTRHAELFRAQVGYPQ